MPGILARLRQRGIVPRKRLGQHFLTDRRRLEALAAAADLSRADRVLEIGAGPGTLTRILGERAGEVVSLEVDAELAEFARSELSDLLNVRILKLDILDGKGGLAPEVIEAIGDLRCYKLVANLPYQIATPLLLNLFSPSLSLPLGVVTVQKEVAERLCAQPGSKAYGPASLLLGFSAAVQPLWTLPPGAFQPPPKVWSRVIRLEPRARLLGEPGEFTAYSFWVKRLFSQRRKQIGGLLRTFLGIQEGAEAVKWLGANVEDRPEALAAPCFLQLARRYGCGDKVFKKIKRHEELR